MQNHRRARRHVHAVMGPMLMAGGDDMLRQRRPRQIERAMRIGEHSGAFGRGDLKCRMAEPFDRYRRSRTRSGAVDAPLHDLELVAETPRKPGAREQHEN